MNFEYCFLFEQSNSSSFGGATCAHPRNSYTTKAELKEMPNGQRIDHVFYGFKDGKNDCINVACFYVESS